MISKAEIAKSGLFQEGALRSFDLIELIDLVHFLRRLSVQ
jgi:hypothetical protein